MGVRRRLASDELQRLDYRPAHASGLGQPGLGQASPHAGCSQSAGEREAPARALGSRSTDDLLRFHGAGPNHRSRPGRHVALRASPGLRSEPAHGHDSRWSRASATGGWLPPPPLVGDATGQQLAGTQVHEAVSHCSSSSIPAPRGRQFVTAPAVHLVSSRLVAGGWRRFSVGGFGGSGGFCHPGPVCACARARTEIGLKQTPQTPKPPIGGYSPQNDVVLFAGPLNAKVLIPESSAFSLAEGLAETAAEACGPVQAGGKASRQRVAERAASGDLEPGPARRLAGVAWLGVAPADAQRSSSTARSRPPATRRLARPPARGGACPP